jgi:hypothetical protein
VVTRGSRGNAARNTSWFSFGILTQGISGAAYIASSPLFWTSTSIGPTAVEK